MPLIQIATALLISITNSSVAQVVSRTDTFGETIGLGVKYGQGEPLTNLPQLKELGVKWVRDCVDWPTVEPSAGKYIKTWPDDFARRIAFYKANGIGIDFLLVYENPKAYPSSPDKPHNEFNAEAYGKFALEAAKLLKASGVKFVLEVWNEPHNFGIAKAFGGNWQGKAPSPWVDHYVKMVAEVVKNVKAYDPKIVVFDQDDMWVTHYWFLEKGLPAALDGISFHPYENLPEAAAASYDTDWCMPYHVVDPDGSFVSAVRCLREFGTQKLGHVPQMWATEVGYETGGKSPKGPITEEMIAAYVPRTFILAYSAGVKATMWFSSFDGPDGPMGLQANDGKKRKQYYSFKTMSEQLGSYKLVKQVAGMDHLTTGLQAFLFKNASIYKLVAWNIDGTEPVILSKTGKAALHAIDVMGKAVTLAAAKNDKYKINVGIGPIYIEGVPANVSINTATAAAALTQSLADFETERKGWTFIPGLEFPGAKGALARDTAAAHSGKASAKLIANFTDGGAYVGSWLDIADLNVTDVKEISFWVKGENIARIGVRINDGTGQTFQIKALPLVSTKDWQHIVLKTKAFEGMEHWGGANDGKYHEPAKGLGINIGADSFIKTTPAKGTLWIDDVTAVVVPVIKK